MPNMNVPEILIRTYNLFNRPRTWFNHRILDQQHEVFKIANRHGRTNCKVKVDIAELVEENT